MVITKKKKLFIVFSGELRFFEQNFLSIKKNLNEFEKIYLFYPWTKEKSKIELFKKYHNNGNIEYILEQNWKETIERIKYPDYAASIPSLFYMWDALTQSFLKIRNKLSDDDVIMRFRTDIKIHSTKLNLNLNDIKDNTLYIPDCYHWNGYNDQVFVSKVKTLSRFDDFFEFINFSIDNNDFICPEYNFYKFLKKKKINTIFFEFNYQILKNQKIINNKKLFVKEKKSYIPLKDKINIKFLKILYKFRNFKNFYIKKKNRNRTQNIFDE